MMSHSISELSMSFSKEGVADEAISQLLQMEKVEDRCGRNFLNDVMEMKNGKNNLEKRIREITLALKNYPLVERLYQRGYQNVKQLEQCVICLCRGKIILSQKLEDSTECRGENERTISCLEADSKSKIIMIDNLKHEVSELISNKEIDLKKKEETEKLSIDLEIETERLVLKIKELSHLTHELIMEKKEKSQENIIKKDNVIKEFKQHFIHYEEISKDQINYLKEYSKEVTDLKKLNEKTYPGTIEDLNRRINQNIKDQSKMIGGIKQLNLKIDDLKEAIEFSDQRFEICCEKRLKWNQSRAINKQLVLKLNKEIEKYRGVSEIIENNGRKLIILKNPSNCEIMRMNKDCTIIHDLKQTNYKYNKTLAHLLQILSVLEEICLISVGQQDKETPCRKSLQVSQRNGNSGMHDQLYMNLKRKYDANVHLSRRTVELEEIIRKRDKHLQDLKNKRKNLCAQYDLLLKMVEKYERAIEEYSEKKKLIDSNFKIVSAEYKKLVDKEMKVEQQLKEINEDIKNQLLNHDNFLQEEKKLNEAFEGLKKLLAIEQENNEKVEKHIKASSAHDNVSEIIDLIEIDSTQEMYLRSENDGLKSEYQKLKHNQSLVEKLEEIVKKQRKLLVSDYSHRGLQYEGGAPVMDHSDIYDKDSCSDKSSMESNALIFVPDHHYCCSDQDDVHSNWQGFSEHSYNEYPLNRYESCLLREFNILDDED